MLPATSSATETALATSGAPAGCATWIVGITKSARFESANDSTTAATTTFPAAQDARSSVVRAGAGAARIAGARFRAWRGAAGTIRRAAVEIRLPVSALEDEVAGAGDHATRLLLSAFYALFHRVFGDPLLQKEVFSAGVAVVFVSGHGTAATMSPRSELSRRMRLPNNALPGQDQAPAVGSGNERRTDLST